MPVRSLEPRVRHLNAKEPYARVVDAIGVHRAAGHKRQRARLANDSVFAAVFFVVSLQEKAKMDFLMRMRRHPQAGRMCRFCQAQACYLAEPKEIGPGTA